MLLNPQVYVADNKEEAEYFYRSLHVENLVKEARTAFTPVHKVSVRAPGREEAFYAVCDPRVIRILDAIIIEL
jgi:hypothetical protein